MLEGGCLCGGVRFRIRGKLGPFGFCHCVECRKSSGSAFTANAPVRAKYFELVGGEELTREYESSPGKWRVFCSRCGSPVWAYLEGEPETRRIRLGTLDGDPERRPLVHVWVSERAPWYEIRDELPRFERGLVREGGET